MPRLAFSWIWRADLTRRADTTLVAWSWDFGDGNTSTAQNPTHFYATSGTYNVSLTVTNVLGCSHTTVKSNFVDVLAPPNTFFVPNANSGCTPFDASFTDQSTAGSAPVVAWAWDFGDGNTSTAQNPTHLYATPGIYNVVLVTTDNNGCSSSFSQNLTAFTLPSAAFFSPDTVGCSPISIPFFDLSTGDYNLTIWQWDFGDGNGATQQFPTHTYTADGNYDVQLMVEDENGCRDTTVISNYIKLTNPVANFTLDQPLGCPGLDVSFTDTSIPDTTLVSWIWDFGDGSSSVVQNPQHVYANPGVYTVSLTITNVLGCADTYTWINAVSVSTPPTANFTLSDSIGCTPFGVRFTDLSQAISSPIVSWTWDFGTGDSSLIQEPAYTFDNAGTFPVKLLVEDGLGCRDSISRNVISTNGPEIDFMTMDSISCAPTPIAFLDQTTSDYPLVSWQWSFGDGNGSTQQNPTNTYLNDGLYTVSLITEDVNGCRDTLVKPDYIYLRHPNAGFAQDQINGCEESIIQFTDTSATDTTLVLWNWDFGNGDISVLQNPAQQFNQSGVFDVSLTIMDVFGCRDSITKPSLIEIFESPLAGISASDTSGCIPFQVDFEDLSTSPYGVVGWEWLLDGTPKGNSQTVSHFFTTPGDYEITLIITDGNGCTDTATQMVFVRDIPVANFTASDTLGCAAETISFFDQSIPLPVSWQWDFGDGNTSNQQNPVHTYTEDGIYSVSLAIEDQYGCTAELTKTNYIVLDHPEADFDVIFEAGCAPVIATFNASATGLLGIANWRWDYGDGTTETSLSSQTTHAFDAPGSYTVTLIATDSLGCTDTVVVPNAVTVLEDVFPDPIGIYNVSVVDDNKIAVSFAATPASDFAFYTIYRETPGVGFEPIHTTFYQSDTVYLDVGVDPLNNRYCYKVTVTNFCDSESNLDLTRNHCTINATATPLEDEIVIDWTAYVGWTEVAQYEIYKVNDYDTVNVEFLGLVSGQVTRYIETITDCYASFNYRIKAIGREKLETSWSDTTTALGSGGLVGAETELVRATVENNEDVLVEWKEFNSTTARILYLEKAKDNGNFATIATLPPNDVKFLDTDVDVAFHTYAYRISSQDSCGNATELSNVGKSILLQADQELGTTVLSWTPYEDWRFGVREYYIEVFVDSLGRWELVDIVQGTVNNYADKKTTLDQPQHCYRIRAIELGGNNAESFSNEVCIDVEAGVFAADAFTPNQDGINDVFVLKGLHVQTFNLKIFSRWGLLLFETNNMEEGWDGRFKGEDMPEGVYTYVAKGRAYDGKPFVVKGTITMYR
ncbi:MAG: PKD domain-containing protein [Bacteroidota bacterium]